MTYQDRVGAAYHEAGHAVIASALGLSVGRMEIAINGDDAKGAADIEIEGALLLPLVDQLAICAAGMEAQEVFEAPKQSAIQFRRCDARSSNHRAWLRRVRTDGRDY